jgi:hypothetical protein
MAPFRSPDAWVGPRGEGGQAPGPTAQGAGPQARLGRRRRQRQHAESPAAGRPGVHGLSLGEAAPSSRGDDGGGL